MIVLRMLRIKEREKIPVIAALKDECEGCIDVYFDKGVMISLFETQDQAESAASYCRGMGSFQMTFNPHKGE